MRAAIARRGQMVVEDVPEPVPGAGRRVGRGEGLRDLRLGSPHAPSRRQPAGGRRARRRRRASSTRTPTSSWATSTRRRWSSSGPRPTGRRWPSATWSSPCRSRSSGAGLEPIGFSNTYNGAYADRMRLTAGMCLKVPNGLDARRAALTEPMTVGLHAVNKSGIKQGEGALVLGCGPVGLAVIAALASKGIEPIVAADFSGRRRAIATAMGAHEVVTPHDRVRDRRVEAGRRREAGRPLRGDRRPRHHRPGDARRAAAEPHRDRRCLHGDRSHAPARRHRQGAEPPVHLLLRPDRVRGHAAQHRGGRARRHADAHRSRRGSTACRRRSTRSPIRRSR